MFESNSPRNILRRRAKLIVFVGFLFAVFSVAISLLFPLQYRADADVLIISKSRYGVDPYTVVKSAERVGDNLIEIMKTSDFYDKVMSNPTFSLDKSRFEGQNLTERQKRKHWAEDLNASVVYGTGVVRISAYHVLPEQSKNLAAAAADTLATRGWEYVGGDVSIKVVNPPVATLFPVRPNLPINALVGFGLGVILMAMVAVRRGNI
jgi:capsular polysaccharide biosynthesis protein